MSGVHIHLPSELDPADPRYRWPKGTTVKVGRKAHAYVKAVERENRRRQAYIDARADRQRKEGALKGGEMSDALALMREMGMRVERPPI